MLTKLSLGLSWIKSSRDVTKLNVEQGSQAHHPGATWYTGPLCLVCPKPTCTGCHLVDY